MRPRLFPTSLLNKYFSYSLYWLALVLCVACVPAQVPPQLAQTPGASVVIADERYQSDVFSVAIPEGWRVVTSEVQAPLTVTLVAPDDCALIIISTAALEDMPRSPACEGETRTDLRTLTLNGVRLWVGGSAAATGWLAFVRVYERSYASITNSP
ncbi:MAG: hypothetical protein SF123_05770 [Chloroflexota bacterium]|nr:hypothetical protein [Chloroflexota bacterium]